MFEIKKGNNKFYIGDTSENPKAEVTYINHDENTIIIEHTFVSDELTGQKIGHKLIKKIVDFAIHENKKILPKCSFAKKEFTKNKAYEIVLFNNPKIK